MAFILGLESYDKGSHIPLNSNYYTVDTIRIRTNSNSLNWDNRCNIKITNYKSQFINQ